MERVIKVNLSFVNAFIIKTDCGCFLIDTGLSSSWNQLDTALRSNGCSPGKLKMVIATHGDADHIGNCRNLQEIYKAKIAIHPADGEMAEKGRMRKRSIRPVAMKMLFLVMKLFLKFSKLQTFKPDVYLEDNETLEKYGLDAKIIHIPGHTEGSIAILTKGKNLFVGDTIVNRKGPSYATIIEDKEALSQSIKKLRQLDVETVFTGHGDPFPGNMLSQIKVVEL
jgi:hydroxyacylglutathione hydrolase